jgi:1,4-alpha-glucan branching enzyme
LSHNPTGQLSLVLHCHLPYVRDPEHEFFLEENWYFEALFETYLPLLATFERLEGEGVPFRLTLSVSPTLLALCSDGLLQKRAVRYIDLLIGLAEKERKRVQNLPAFQPVVEMYLRKFKAYRSDLIGKYHGNVAEGFRRFQQKGNLEVITCAATHGFLPLLAAREEAVRAQVATALKAHKAFFGSEPAGFWLPECGYQPGLDAVLAEFGLRYFFLESHGLLQATPKPQCGTFAPILCPSGLAAFGRDMECSKQVWSSKEGYPGDPDYREFYRDAGYDLAEEELHPYLRPEGIRRFTGLKYHRVTGPTDRKEPYDPARALRKAEEHASDFVEKRMEQVRKVSPWMERPPLMVCMYDAELFGHWWYEGPDFLYFLFKKAGEREGAPDFTLPSDYLRAHPRNQPTQPVFSSWGVGGYSEFWLNEKNDWIYPYLTQACAEMAGLAGSAPPAGAEAGRALNQAARELLLAQASDWAFMMKAGNYAAFAEKRFKSHLSRFYQMTDQARRGKVDGRLLADLERKDALFPDIDYRDFRPAGGKGGA